MRLHCLAIVVAVPPPAPLTPTLSLAAQVPLRVVRHAPSDTARPNHSITISFDRPVGGSVDRTPDPRRILRIEPAIEARFEWRDPVTLRVIPRTPLAPGSRYQVTLSNDFSAMDGGRLGAPYRFTIATKGPALLTSVPRLAVGSTALLEPNGRLRLVYSAPIDTATFARSVRLELAAGDSCERRTFRYAVRSVRGIEQTDPWELTYAGGYQLDSIERAYRRIVELRPVAAPPPGCRGDIVIPSLDPTDQAEIRYSVETTPLFTLSEVVCDYADCVAGGWISVGFSAPVHRDSARGRIRIEPAVPFTFRGYNDVQHSLQLRLRMSPRTRYVVRIDSSLEDVYGRRLTGRRTDTLTTGDRAPALGHPTGFTTISRAQPLFRVRHVNIDTVELAITPIPESLRVAALQASSDADSIVRLVARLRPPLRHRVVLHTSFNVEQTTAIAIPRAILGLAGGTSLFAIRANGGVARSRAAEEAGITVLRLGPADTVPIADMRPYALVQFSDLIAHAKVSDAGGSVLVMNGSTGTPVSDARVTARDTLDRVIAAGTTDSAGVATLAPTGLRPARGPHPGSRRYPVVGDLNRDVRVVEVTQAGDRSLTIVGVGAGWGRVESVGRLGGHQYEPTPVRANVLTDRAIYRPGEKIYVTGIVRRGPLADLRPPAAGDSVRLRIARVYPGESEPRTVRERMLHVTRFGTVADSFALSANAPLGGYTVSLDAYDGEWHMAGQAWLQLAEYRAPEFQTTLTLDTAVRFLGDSITLHVGGRYYFGAPMAGAVFRWSTFTSDHAGVSIPGLPGDFVIGTHYSAGQGRGARSDVANGSDTLEASGTLTLRLPTTLGSSTMPAWINVSVSVDDANRQAVSATKAIVLHSSNYYIAVRESGPRSWYWRANAPKRFDVVTVRPDGRRVARVRVRVAVVRHRRVAELQDDGSAPSWKEMSDTLTRGVVVTRDSIVQYEFTPAAPGYYELVFTGSDDASRPLKTSTGGSVDSPAWWNFTDNPLAIPVEVDSTELAPGDTLTVRFTSPFVRAEAWVTAEREGVLAGRRFIAMQGENSVRIPVTQAFIPSAEIAVLLADTRAVWQADSTHHRFRAGYGRIDVSRESKTLAVTVRPESPRYAPGDSARILLTVRDHRAQPVIAAVTVWAVDEGVLALTGYGRPSPSDQIHSAYGTALRLGTTTMTVAQPTRLLRLQDLMEVRELFLASGVAGANALGAAAGNGVITIATGRVPRSDFRSTAFYIASLETDANGNATAAVKLPDNLTTFRVIAVAVTNGDAYGAGDSTITLTRPLIARPSLPRFLRAGDAIRAGAVLNNTTRDSLVARIVATGERVAFVNDMTATRTLVPGAAAEVRFDWRVTGAPGDSSLFRFAVTGGVHTDAVDLKVPVRAPYSPRFHAVSGVTRGPAAVRIMLPAGIDPRRSSLTLRVGSSPVPLVRAAYAWIDVYAFQCSEQLTSTGQVVLAMIRLQRAGLLDSTQAPTAATLRGRLQFVLDELARRQDFFGAIGYWSAGSWSTRWLSAYAGQLMVDARSLGLAVDSVVVNRIGRFMRFEPDTASVIPGVQYGTRVERARDVAGQLADDLAVLHFLRDAGTADTTRENQMVRRASEMIWEDRVWLAELLAGRRDRSAARAQLERVWRDVEQAGQRVDIPDSLVRTLGFRSHVRPATRLLRATLAANPDHPSLAALIERIVQLGRAEHHRMWNTQDYAVLANAMANLAIAQRRGGPPSEVTVRSAANATKNRVLFAGTGDGVRDGSVSLEGLLQREGEWMSLPLTIEGGTDPTFYVLTVDEVPLTPPTTPDVKGIAVERWFERFDDGRTVTEVVEGDLVRGRLRITVPTDREFVAVEDLLPAGLEVFDVRLRTSSIGPFQSEASRDAMRAGNRANGATASQPWLYGSWAGGWWSPWEHEEKRDDRVTYFARVLWKGTYTATYVARATTVGTFVHPPAHAEEMYNPSVGGRSDGGTFRVLPRQ